MHLPRRYDNALMHPPGVGDAAGSTPGNSTGRSPRTDVDTALLARLRGWCEVGTSGSTLQARSEPLRVASIASSAGLDAAAGVLDGSHELARLGRWRGLLWRLQILWREQTTPAALQPSPHPVHPFHPGNPWDCGWWRDGALAPAEAFRPRRPTLLMLRHPTPADTTALLTALRTHSPAYARPVRVLVVSPLPVAGMPRL